MINSSTRRLMTLRKHFTTTTTPTTTSPNTTTPKKYDWSLHQENLPRLPLPSLQDTLERYLESVRPLHDDIAHQATTIAVHDFLHGGRGVTLHAELMERNRQAILLNEQTSYVRPFWNDMYLQGSKKIFFFSKYHWTKICSMFIYLYSFLCVTHRPLTHEFLFMFFIFFRISITD